jgi:hypothetical protein
MTTDWRCFEQEESVSEKTKTTVTVPQELLEQVSDLSDRLGIGRNAVVCLGCAMAVVKFSPLIGAGRRRVAMLQDIARTFQKLMEEARN